MSAKTHNNVHAFYARIVKHSMSAHGGLMRVYTFRTLARRVDVKREACLTTTKGPSSSYAISSSSSSLSAGLRTCDRNRKLSTTAVRMHQKQVWNRK